MLRNKILYLIFIAVLPVVHGYGQVNQTARQKPKIDLMVFGTISLYENDPRISANTGPLAGYGISIRTELPISKGIKLVTGLELISQGLKFDSYYFSNGYSVLFDKNFNYNHLIRTYEVDLPLLMRVNLTPREESAYHSFYFSAGWEIKYNLLAHSTISNSSDGSLIYDGDIDLPYENHFLGKNVGNYLVAGLGYVHTFLPLKDAVFFDFTYRYCLSRNLYTGNQNSNYLFFRNTSLSMGVGVRF